MATKATLQDGGDAVRAHVVDVFSTAFSEASIVTASFSGRPRMNQDTMAPTNAIAMNTNQTNGL
jgi:hypothetical protein